MSRYIPDHPKKGSPEAYAWAEKMRAARAKKKRLAHTIREAGRKTEREFFGPGGPLEVKALKRHKLNPGAKWHKGEEDVAYRYKKQAKDQLEKAFFAGVEAAHQTSGSAARKMGMNPYEITARYAPYQKIRALEKQSILRGQGIKSKVIKEKSGLYALKVKKNPIAIYNPASPAGTIYNNAIEIRAQKTGGPLKGHYKHVFGKNVRIIGLTDGTVLLQHRDGKPLWITRKDYERSGRKH